jgi:purine-binding chemotaxis protein CheW
MIIRGLSFLADGEFFAVDVTLVQKVARNLAVTPVPAAPEAIVGIANMKGRVVTVLSLAALFGRGRDKITGEKGAHIINAVVFKPFTEGDDQMGLFIDRPGDLIDISDKKILPLSLKTGAEEKFYLSGTAEVESNLYRIINIEAIIKRFADGGKSPAGTLPQGGTYE